MYEEFVRDIYSGAHAGLSMDDLETLAGEIIDKADKANEEGYPE